MAQYEIELGSKGGGFFWTNDEMSRGLINLEKQTLELLRRKMIAHSAAATRYARANRRWTDRSGRARETLNSTYKVDSTTIGFVLSHGMYYGVYLEARKEFEIIETTLKAMAPRVMQNLNNMFGELGGLY